MFWFTWYYYQHIYPVICIYNVVEGTPIATTPRCRMFANSSGDSVSIPGRDIPKTHKMVLVASLLIIIRYGLRVNLSDPGKGVAPSSTSRCSNYWKGSLRFDLDNSRQLSLYIYIYISITNGRKLNVHLPSSICFTDIDSSKQIYNDTVTVRWVFFHLRYRYIRSVCKFLYISW